MKFLVCALFYGDYPELAARCAASLKALRDTGRVDLRIGLNEVSQRSAALIDAQLPGVECIRAEPQIYKYPMMRRLVHEYQGDATHLMWFDDDSCLLPGLDVARWLGAVSLRAECTPGALGTLFAAYPTPVEQAWAQAQPWHTGRTQAGITVFPLGAWFVLALSFFRQFDWPPARLRHNGGDMALGTLLHQQQIPMTQFHAGLAIDSDSSLRQRSSARRGFSERPLGI